MLLERYTILIFLPYMIHDKPTEISKDIAKHVRAELPNVLAIYLFGSFATGETNTESDIDIAIFIKPALSADALLKLSYSLTQVFNRDFDIIDLSQVPTVLRMQIISTGIRLFCKNAMTCETFEDFVFSDYARLNEERAGILHDIRQRGSVYG